MDETWTVIRPIMMTIYALPSFRHSPHTYVECRISLHRTQAMSCLSFSNPCTLCCISCSRTVQRNISRHRHDFSAPDDQSPRRPFELLGLIFGCSGQPRALLDIEPPTSAPACASLSRASTLHFEWSAGSVSSTRVQ